MNLSKRSRVTFASVPVAAGTTAASGAVIDMQGYEGAMFLFGIGTESSTSGGTCAVQGAAASTGAFTTLSGASKTYAAGDDDKGIVIDVWKPRYRYLRSLFTPSTTAGTEFGGVFCTQYGARKYPTVHGTSTLVTSGVVLAVSTT